MCHKDWYIQRLREFYARKIKYTASNFSEKLTQILDGFPRLDDIHPYYANLINVLYSKHHYKLALGQISTARTLIDNLCKDYLRSIVYADTQYRCKELKRAALGRMATIAKKLNTSLGYLERVRQHLSRLPSINPNTRTVMVSGFPSVGKSSFINKVSRADVEVQPYAFTTKSIFVGHFYYQDQPWQVIDTPGILDHNLEDRNIIEMQAITALAYLQSTVLFMIDVSETCGYSIEKQVSLYHNIKALFSNKPLLVVCTKTDLKKWEELDQEDRDRIESVAKDRDTNIMFMSNETEEGVSKVKATACDMLLRLRCEKNIETGKVDKIANRINVAMPTRRDNVQRKPNIPENVKQRLEQEKKEKDRLAQELRETGLLDDDSIKRTVKEQVRESREKIKTLHDLEEEHTGFGKLSFDYREYFDLKEEDWKFDVIPEIMDGHNIADFYDEDITARLNDLEEEEAELQQAFEESGIELQLDQNELTEEQYILLKRIRAKKSLLKDQHRMKTGRTINGRAILPRNIDLQSVEQAKQQLQEMGLDTDKYEQMVPKKARKRLDDVHFDEEVDELAPQRIRKINPVLRESSNVRALSKMRTHSSHALSQTRMRGVEPAPADGYKDKHQKDRAEKASKREWKQQIKYAREGESDRRYVEEMPKHIYRDKRGLGTYRR